mmetsp:Transcript_25982/g.64526  ORF Transcript_25982/g.64526 Transcript_25982/m.64526 type:complete len:401 (-) Transcript_25982:560-1762(-)
MEEGGDGVVGWAVIVRREGQQMGQQSGNLTLGPECSVDGVHDLIRNGVEDAHILMLDNLALALTLDGLVCCVAFLSRGRIGFFSWQRRASAQQQSSLLFGHLDSFLSFLSRPSLGRQRLFQRTPDIATEATHQLRTLLHQDTRRQMLAEKLQQPGLVDKVCLIDRPHAVLSVIPVVAAPTVEGSAELIEELIESTSEVHSEACMVHDPVDGLICPVIVKVSRQAAFVLQQAADAREKRVEVLLIHILGRTRRVLLINKKQYVLVNNGIVAENTIQSREVGFVEGHGHQLLVTTCSSRNQGFDDVLLSLARWPHRKHNGNSGRLRLPRVLPVQTRASTCWIVNRQINQTQLQLVQSRTSPPTRHFWDPHAGDSHSQTCIRPLLDQPRHVTPCDVPPQKPTH